MERFCVLKDFEDIANGKWINNNKDAYRGVESIGDIIEANNVSLDEEGNIRYYEDDKSFETLGIILQNCGGCFESNCSEVGAGYNARRYAEHLLAFLKNKLQGGYEKDLYLDLYYSIQYKISKCDERLKLPKWEETIISYGKKGNEETGSMAKRFDGLWDNYHKPKRKYEALKFSTGELSAYIKNISPNVVRIQIISPSFRQVFQYVKGKSRKNYFSENELKEIIERWGLNLRIDDLWLLKKVLGFELVEQLYNFLSEIYDTLAEQNKENDTIEEFCELLMRLPGYYFKIELIAEFSWIYRTGVLVCNRRGDEALQFFIDVMRTYDTKLEEKEYVRNMKDVLAWKWNYDNDLETNLNNALKWLETRIDPMIFELSEIKDNNTIEEDSIIEKLYEILSHAENNEMDFYIEYKRWVNWVLRYLHINGQEEEVIEKLGEITGLDRKCENIEKDLPLYKDISAKVREVGELIKKANKGKKENKNVKFYNLIQGCVIIFGNGIKEKEK